MEKVIKMFADKDAYNLCVDDNEIKINYNTKTLDSKQIYDYIFKGCNEKIDVKLENHVDDFFETYDYRNLADDGSFKRKIKSESSFIFNKIDEMISSLVIDINALVAESINDA
ncbi:MAG: hypothetical protein RSC93_10310 [Erysipelotrichaceae bacterium]